MNLRKLFDELSLTGGFTYNLATGDVPTNGYMVSLLGYEELYDTSTFKESDLQSFVLKNITKLSSEKEFLGAWVNDKKVFLDVSINIENLERAIYVGIINKQQAIHNCNNGEIIALPSPQTFGTETQNKSYNQMKAKQLAFLLETTEIE